MIFDPYAAARPTLNNIIVKVPVDIDKGLAFTGQSEIELGYMLAHEMIHCLQEHKYGKWTFNPFFPPPLWKLEGYPEYVARQTMIQREGYDLKSEIKNYLTRLKKSENGIIEVTEKHYLPILYYKSRLMVEYLIDIKQLSYDDILQITMSEDEVYGEMLGWAGIKQN